MGKKNILDSNWNQSCDVVFHDNPLEFLLTYCRANLAFNERGAAQMCAVGSKGCEKYYLEGVRKWQACVEFLEFLKR